MAGYPDEWLALEKRFGRRPCLSGSLEDVLEQMGELGAWLAPQLPPPDPEVETADRTADGVPVRVYQPKGNTATGLPLGIYMHSGGWIAGDLDKEDAMCRAVAHHTPCVVVSVDYRLAPKHKLTKILDDCITATKWAHKYAARAGASPDRLFTFGGSAGGAMALMIPNKLIASGDEEMAKLIKGIVALVPVTVHPRNVPQEYRGMYKSYAENGTNVPIVDGTVLMTIWDTLQPDPSDPELFVALSKHLAKFPPTYVAVCGKDPLRDDGVMIEAMLRKVGVKTKIDRYEGLPHYFWDFPIPQSQTFVANVIAGVKFVLGL